jgi:para-nitrobenzyl esterase
LFIKKNGKLKINNGKIVLIGTSAGTETVLKNTIFSKDFKFVGIISMARAIILLDDVTRKSAITTQLFQGIADELTPYNTVPQHYCKKTAKGNYYYTALKESVINKKNTIFLSLYY